MIVLDTDTVTLLSYGNEKVKKKVEGVEGGLIMPQVRKTRVLPISNSPFRRFRRRFTKDVLAAKEASL
jgi:hypothetical protein